MIDQKTMSRLVAFALVAWSPAAVAVLLLATADLQLWGPIVLTLGGLAAATVLAARRAFVPAGMKPRSAVGGSSASWTGLANPDGIHANRWASYADLFSQLTTRDWTRARVAEIGGTNEVLHAMFSGAEYTQLAYPEFDIQDLHAVPDERFEVVILDQTLEHVLDPQRALLEVRRVLVDEGVAVISTPFLVPVHEGEGYGDYYRWTPKGLSALLERCGFDAEVRSWGNRPAAQALLDNMYLMAGPARRSGLGVELADSDPEFPVTVWAVARKRIV